MNPSRRQLWATALLFVLSGLTGLVYETVWFKRLGHAWGSSSFAMASVVATFLCGLGIGAFFAGRIADRSKRPLALYGWCELAIAGLALAVPYELGFLLERAAPLAYEVSGTPWLASLLRFALTFLVIGPPCIAMGATLPLLTRQFAVQGLSLGASAAWLYAFNALGAAAGAWISGFFLLEKLGLVWTNGAAAATNFAIGVAALALSRAPLEPAPQAEVEAPTNEMRSEDSVAPRALHLAALASGVASITLQMLWSRELALLLGGTTYAFSATLALFILGLGLGSLWFRLSFAGAPRLDRLVSLASAAIVLATLAGLALEPQLAVLVGHLKDARSSGGFNAVLCAGVAAALQLVPTIGMGLLFPALVQLSRQGAARAGQVVGGIYAWNTLGSIAGAASASLVILPALGSHWTFRGALLAYAVIPILLFRARSLAVATAIGCSALLLSDWRQPDPLATNVGAYMYGPSTPDDVRSTMRTVLFREGANCNVLVLQGTTLALRDGTPPDQFFNLRANGKIDASSSEDMPTQLGIAYVPLFLRPRAKDVLVIGMGSGTTAGAAALFPGTVVTVCEIEAGVVEATKSFERVNHRPLERPNVEVVLDDGRSFLQGHPGGWDVIVSEPSNPWLAGVANLFTEEFYRTAERKLAPGGMLAQWLQTYSFSAEDYALVVRTIQSVFPHCAFLHIGPYDTLILAGTAPLFPGAAELDEAQRVVEGSPEIRADLERWFDTTDVRTLILARLWLDERGLARFATTIGGNSHNTDLNMRLEFSAPRRLFGDSTQPAARTFEELLRSADAGFQQELYARWRCGPAQLDALRHLKSQLLQAKSGAAASGLVSLGLAYDPDDAELAVDRLLFDQTVTREEFEEQSARVIATAPLEALRLGRQLSDLGQHNAARVVFDKLCALHPESATAWALLAGELETLAKPDEAKAARERGAKLDPLNDLFNQYLRPRR